MAQSRRKRGSDETLQLGLFGAQDQKLRNWILNLDISSMAPLEALIELNKLKQYLDKKPL
jgi:hypothetical protein